MASLYNSIYNLLVENPNKTNTELIKIFGRSKPDTIRDYASRIRKLLKEQGYKPSNTSDKKNTEMISLAIIEPIIYRKIMHNPTNQDLKLAVEILKIKAQDKGLQDDLDIDKYVKKTLTKLSQDDIEEVMKEEAKFLHSILSESEDTNTEDPDDYNEESEEYYD